MNNKAFILDSRRALVAGIIVVQILFSAGCQTISRVRTAQDTFNRAASVENTLKIEGRMTDPGGGAATTSSLSVRADYAEALRILTTLSPEEQRSLQADKLMGNAITMQAICHWKLGDYDKAFAAVTRAQALQEQLFPRDVAILAALPGLIMNDQAYAIGMKVNSANPTVEERHSIEDAIRLLKGTGDRKGAISIIKQAQSATDDKHPVQAYLIQCQLVCYRNLTFVKSRIGPASLDEDEKSEAKGLITKLGNLTNDQSLAAYWRFLLGLQVG